MAAVTGFMVDPDHNRAEVREVADGDRCDEFYSMLNCDTIDIVGRKVCGKMFDFVCDDEGLLKLDPRISATSPNTANTTLVGRLFICNSRGSSLTSLDDADIALLKSRLCVLEYGTPQKTFENIGLELDD